MEVSPLVRGSAIVEVPVAGRQRLIRQWVPGCYFASKPLDVVQTPFCFARHYRLDRGFIMDFAICSDINFEHRQLAEFLVGILLFMQRLVEQLRSFRQTKVLRPGA